MADHVTIAQTFSGPPDSGNGGYVCGVAAAQFATDPDEVDGEAIEVTLRLPPPLERPLRVDRSPDGVGLLDGDALVAEARSTVLDVTCPEPITPSQARDAASHFDLDTYAHIHPFGNCYVCGPDRAVGAGLRIFPAPLPGHPEIAAWPWKPYPSLADASGRIRFEFLWSALDCPSCFGYWLARGMGTPVVLGRLAAEVRRRPTVDEPLVVGGWLIGQDGRKVLGGSAVWDGDGSVVAIGRATWIELRAEQAPSFTGR